MNDPEVVGEGVIWARIMESAGYGLTHDIVQFSYGVALTHRKAACVGPCVIHSPSDHRMRHMPTLFRSGRQMIERVCAHGYGHPDPDQVTYWQQTLSPTQASAQFVHGCCEQRCCIAPTEKEDQG